MKKMSYPRFLARAAMTLLAVFCCLTGARAQETLTVYDDGTNDNSYVPFYGLYADTQGAASECVIPSDLLEDMAGGTITAMTFYLKTPASDAWTGTHQVYIGEVDATTLTGITGPDAFTVVKTASFDATGTELTVEFDEPYTYEGGNLLIGTYVSVAGNWKSAAFYGVNQTENTGWYRNNGTATGNGVKFIPKTTFEYTPGSGSGCEKPTNLVATVIDAHSATLTWASEVGSYNIEYKKASLPNDDENWTSIEGDIDRNEFTLTDLEQNTAYNARVRAVCDSEEGDYSGWRTVNFTTPVSCPAPTALAVALTPGDGSVATLSWTENGSATSWQICLNDDEDNLIAADSNPFKLTKLTPETAYTAKVRAVGNDEYSSWTDNISFTPTNAYFITVNDGTDTNGYVPIYGYYVDQFSKGQFIIPADDLADMTYGTISKLTFYAKADKEWGAAEFEVYMTEVNNTTFSEATLVDWTTMEKVMNAGSLAIVGNKMEITLDAPYQYLGGNLLIGVLQTTKGTYASCDWYGVSSEENVALGGYENSKAIGYQTFLPKTTFYYTPGEAPACPKPTGLTVNYEGGREATISWTSDATAWNLSVNGVETPVTQNPYTLTNLELGTTYEVKVQAVCSDIETSDWTNAVSFKTDNCMPEDMCQLTFTLSDSYGDSWNGASIAVYDYTGETMGDLLASLTISSGLGAGVEQTTTLNFCNGQELAIIWNSGSYDDECSYTITDLNGDIVAQDDTELAIAYTIDCTVTDCRRPTDFAASEIGPHSAVLSWTENGEATAWVIEYMAEDDEESTTITAESNPYTLTGLNPETTYYARVSPVCDDDAVKPSEVISWTTTVAAPTPTDLAANRVNANSANLNWEGEADVYNVRYTQPTTADPSAPATIILTVGDVWGDGTGYQMLLDADATAYGTIIPTEGALTSAESYAEFEHKIPVNADGSLTTENIVINNSISIQIPAGTYDWCITNPTPGDRIWIASSNGNVGGRQDDFVFEPGMTYEFTISLDGTNDRVDFVETAPVGEWITVEGVTCPYQLTGLDPETEYYWQVQGNFGEDGLSAWSSTSTFTTGSYSDAPTELAATATSSTATLEWTGSQDSYNVRYRVTSHGAVLAEQNFDDSSLGNWTTIDADGDGYGWVLGSAVDGVYLQNGGSLAGQGHNDSAELLTSGSYSNVVGELTPDNYLVSPQVDLGGSISFYAQAQDFNYPAEHFGVAVSTTGNTDAADFTTIAEWTMNADGTGSSKEAGSWGIFTVDLSEYAGQQGYVAIRHFNCTDQFLLNIDDIVIEAPAQAETEWTELTVSDNSVEIDGLESNTEYEWQVQGILDEGTTNWTIGDNFTTLPLIELANDATDNSTLISDNKDAVADVILAGRTLFKDGSWNTLCLPFDLTLEGSPLEGATAKTLANASITGSHVSLTFGSAVTTLEAGVPYIIKWNTPEEDNISNPTFTGVTIKEVDEDVHTVSPIDGVKFIGYYDAFDITPDNENIYYMTAGNELKHTGKARTLKACRAYFDFSESAVRGFTLNFGDSEATGIVSIDNEQLNNESGWYTVDGKKLDKQPKRKGVYINNGIKVVIK